MGKEDGVLARHSVECTGNIDWEGAKIVGRETGLRQRKVREGIESLRNDTMEWDFSTIKQLKVWKPILNDYSKRRFLNILTSENPDFRIK